MSDAEKDDVKTEALEHDALVKNEVPGQHGDFDDDREGHEADAANEDAAEVVTEKPSTKETDGDAPRQRLRRRAAEKAVIVKKPKRERAEQSPKKAGASGFSKPVKVSDELANFIGQNEISRPQLTKFMWAYFKENGLQDPADKRHIIADDKLKHLLKVDRFNAFGFMKLVKPHFIG